MRGNCDWPNRSALSKIRASFREGVGGGLKSGLLSGRGQEGVGPLGLACLPLDMLRILFYM